MQNLKTVDFGVAFTLTRPAPADYEDKDGNTQTAAANEPRFNYSNGVAQGLLLDASLSETAAIDDVPLFNSSAGHWIIDATFDDSEPLKGMGLDERFDGSGKMVVSYSGGTAKVWAGGQAIHTVTSYTPVEPTHICEGGMATIGSLVYKPSVISDADAAALATGDFQLAPFSPGDLFANGEQGAWYDPSDLNTLFQDAAGTIPVTADGDPVGLMLDKSGNDNHASQSTTAAKPVYRTDGSKRWIELDGVDDHLSVPVAAQGDADDSNSVFSASLHDGVSSFYLLGNSADYGLSMLHDATGFRATVRTSSNESAGASSGLFASGTTIVASAIFDLPSGTHDLRLSTGYSDSTSFTPENKTLAPASAIGIRGTQSVGVFGGAVYGLIILSRVVDNDEMLATEQYLSDTAGV